MMYKNNFLVIIFILSASLVACGGENDDVFNQQSTNSDSESFIIESTFPLDGDEAVLPFKTIEVSLKAPISEANLNSKEILVYASSVKNIESAERLINLPTSIRLNDDQKKILIEVPQEISTMSNNMHEKLYEWPEIEHTRYKVVIDGVEVTQFKTVMNAPTRRAYFDNNGLKNYTDYKYDANKARWDNAYNSAGEDEEWFTNDDTVEYWTEVTSDASGKVTEHYSYSTITHLYAQQEKYVYEDVQQQTYIYDELGRIAEINDTDWYRYPYPNENLIEKLDRTQTLYNYSDNGIMRETAHRFTYSYEDLISYQDLVATKSIMGTTFRESKYNENGLLEHFITLFVNDEQQSVHGEVYLRTYNDNRQLIESLEYTIEDIGYKQGINLDSFDFNAELEKAKLRDRTEYIYDGLKRVERRSFSLSDSTQEEQLDSYTVTKYNLLNQSIGWAVYDGSGEEKANISIEYDEQGSRYKMTFKENSGPHSDNSYSVVDYKSIY